MRACEGFRKRLLSGLALLFLASAHAWVGAAEPARAFLEGLRERGYYDMAIEYLEQMKTSPLAPVEFRETLLYELGTTLIQSSRDQRDIKARQAQLEEAAQALQQFIRSMPDHDLVTSANSQLGNLKVERARIKVEQSKLPNAKREQLLNEAAEIYVDAYGVFEQAQVELRERLTRMTNIPPKDTRAIELRDMLRTDYLQAQLLAAAVKEETADTKKPGSAEYKALVTEAAEQYGQVYEKYRTRLAGLYARMYQGRCSQKLGNHKDALSYFGELLEQPDNPEEFRTLKTKTLLLAKDSWQASKLNAEAVKRLGAWVDGARPNETREPDWLELRLGLARAQWALAQDLRATNPKDPQIRRLESEARKNAQFVSRITGDLQQQARQFLGQIGIEVADAGADDPRNFDEARQLGRDALDSMQTANLLVKNLPGRIANEKDAAVKKELQNQLNQAQETIATAPEDALRYFRMALALADDQTDIRDLNIVRYFLCYLYYTNGDYLEAALLGEFLARRFPDSSGARQSAKIAMAAYLKLYAESGDDDRQFETKQIVGIANYITQKWPKEEEAVEALNTLIPFMIQAGDLDAAERYLTDIPEDSPRRGDAEIKTGQAMWSAYLRGMQRQRRIESGDEEPPEGFDSRADMQQLEELKNRAQRILVAGIARMQKGGAATEASVAAALSLAQIYVDTDQAEKAIELLEDATIGPLVLVRAEHQATSREGFVAEVYKTSLRAYISSLPTAPSSDAVIKKATEVMDAMKQAIDAKQLIGIYYSLARDLETQMSLATDQTKQALSKGFETFLLQLRATSNEFTVLNWVAETFAGMAASFDTQSQLTPEAVKYYQLASETYENILEDAGIEDDKMRIQVRLRLANAKRRLNQFTAARDIYTAILKDNPMMVNVQIDAARMYQDWAAIPPDREALYLRAIQGAEIDSATQKPVIWGWQGIASRTASLPQFRDTFHEARYNLARCLYHYGMAKSGTEREKYLEMAGRSIRQTQQLFGSGPEWDTWRPRYDQLLRSIQRAQNQKPVGLEEATVAQTP
jgi:hypothetical protein